ncbi:hypothetical protein Tco_1321591 [Tanacetum coccineum]
MSEMFINALKNSETVFGNLLGNLLVQSLVIGAEKSAEQIGANTAVVGEDGEVDSKGDAKFGQHMKTGESVSDFAKSKSLSEQHQYLPLFSAAR